MQLTRYLHLEDYEDPDLQARLAVVDRVGVVGQASAHRRWEYALALMALQQWGRPDRFLDVGGAGSPFCAIARLADWDGLVLDPRETGTLAWWRQTPQGQDPVPAVTCLSVLEHIPDEDYAAFLDDLVAVLSPGGLLVLTVDAALAEGPDRHHYAWMRSRIYTPAAWRALRQVLVARGCTPFGGIEETLPDRPAIYGYTFASLVLRKDA